MITVALHQAVIREGTRLAVDPFDTPARLFQGIDWLFPNYTAWTAHTTIVTACWLTLGGAVLGLSLLRELRPVMRARRDTATRGFRDVHSVATSYD
jgi:hypothetical protein